MIDGMGIKENLYYNKLNDSFVGLSADFHILCQPNEALVFMVVGINGDWKQAIGYFLIRGFSASKQASLIKEAIIILHEIDIQVVSLTPDACSTNVAFLRELGCHFKPPLVNSFLHPVQPTLQVYVFWMPAIWLTVYRLVVSKETAITKKFMGKRKSFSY
jgi:hypothetical protein